MTRDGYIFLGEIAKTFGIAGQLLIRLQELTFGIKKKWESVMIEIDGLRVPFFIQSFKIIPGNEIIISLKDIDSKGKAERLTGKKAYIHTAYIIRKNSVIPTTSLEGYLLIDEYSGITGKIIEVLDIPGNLLFKLKTEDREVLIPAGEEIISSIDHKGKKVFVKLTDGIFDI